MTNLTDRLDCGLTGAEALARASVWWDTIGRGLIPASINHETIERAKGPGPNTPAILIKDETKTLPSGILNTLPFEELTHEEKRAVITGWVHGVFEAAEFPAETMPDRWQVLRLSCDHPFHDGTPPEEINGYTQNEAYKQAVQLGWFISPSVDYCPRCTAAFVTREAEA